jgi:hypothetical protein
MLPPVLARSAEPTLTAEPSHLLLLPPPSISLTVKLMVLALSVPPTLTAVPSMVVRSLDKPNAVPVTVSVPIPSLVPTTEAASDKLVPIAKLTELALPVPPTLTAVPSMVVRPLDNKFVTPELESAVLALTTLSVLVPLEIIAKPMVLARLALAMLTAVPSMVALNPDKPSATLPLEFAPLLSLVPTTKAVHLPPLVVTIVNKT